MLKQLTFWGDYVRSSAMERCHGLRCLNGISFYGKENRTYPRTSQATEKIQCFREFILEDRRISEHEISALSDTSVERSSTSHML